MVAVFFARCLCVSFRASPFDALVLPGALYTHVYQGTVVRRAIILVFLVSRQLPFLGRP